MKIKNGWVIYDSTIGVGSDRVSSTTVVRLSKIGQRHPGQIKIVKTGTASQFHVEIQKGLYDKYCTQNWRGDLMVAKI